MHLLRLLIFCAVTGLLAPGIAQGQSDSIPAKKKLSFKDPEDGAFDLSQYLLEANGALPIVLPITEPAVGYGGTLALLYFHHRKKKYQTYVPPNVSGIAGLYTSNKTWGAGAFHTHIFGENRVRTTTAFFKPDIRYKYYGNNSPILEDNPVSLNLDSWVALQKAEVRLGNSKFYAGLTYTYFKTKVSFDTIPNRPIINEILKRLNINSTISSLKPALIYDNRDNVFTPTRGIYSKLALNYSAEWLGSSDDFSAIHTDFFAYKPVSPIIGSGWRFQGKYVLGDAPFYAYPFIDLRGIAAMRYQGNNMMLVETEWSFNVYNRWSLIGFTGGGKAFKSFNDFGSANWAYTYGAGFRYNLARVLGVNMGADFAMGDGRDFAFYVVFGSSWF